MTPDSETTSMNETYAETIRMLFQQVAETADELARSTGHINGFGLVRAVDMSIEENVLDLQAQLLKIMSIHGRWMEYQRREKL
jgi:hypothetical protein